MQEKSRNALVGLFVAGGFAVFFGLMVMFGERPQWLGGVEWGLRITNIPDLRDIRPGIEVTLNGVVIGRLDNIEFNDENRPEKGVYLVVMIKKKYSVPLNAKALVYNPALGIGRGHIELVLLGKAIPDLLPKDGTAAISGRMVDRLRELISDEFVDKLTKAIDHLGELAGSLKPVADDLHGLMQARSVAEVDQPQEGQTLAANFATVVERFDMTLKGINATLEHFNDVVGQPEFKEDVKIIATNIREATRHADELAVSAKEDLHNFALSVDERMARLEGHLDDFFVKLAPVLDNLDNASGQLYRLLREAREGDGTAALLIRDRKLYDETVQTLEQVQYLIATLQPFVDKVAQNERLPIEAPTPIGPVKASVDLKKKESN